MQKQRKALRHMHASRGLCAAGCGGEQDPTNKLQNIMFLFHIRVMCLPYQRGGGPGARQDHGLQDT
jgi:hypothetical protein